MTTDVGAQHDAVNSLALQPDGKIVAAGVADNGPAANFVVVRYDTGGTLDPGFGIGGKVFTDFGGSDGAADVALQPDGKIVAAGGDPTHIAIARYNPNGTPDALFGVNGTIETAFGGFGEVAAEGVVLQPDAKYRRRWQPRSPSRPPRANWRWRGTRETPSPARSSGPRRNDLINGNARERRHLRVGRQRRRGGGGGRRHHLRRPRNDIVFGGAGDGPSSSADRTTISSTAGPAPATSLGADGRTSSWGRRPSRRARWRRRGGRERRPPRRSERRCVHRGSGRCHRRLPIERRRTTKIAHHRERNTRGVTTRARTPVRSPMFVRVCPGRGALTTERACLGTGALPPT